MRSSFPFLTTVRAHGLKVIPSHNLAPDLEVKSLSPSLHGAFNSGSNLVLVTKRNIASNMKKIKY